MTISAGKILLETRPNMIINRDYAPVLTQSGLLDFDRFYYFNGGTVVKQIKERSVIRMTLLHGKKRRHFFLKRHVAAPPEFAALIGHCCQRRSLSPGMAEFENICDFRKNRLATVTPVAAGQRRVGLFRFESFLVTEDVTPCISLEELILDHPERLSGPDGIQRKHRIITAVARLARNMHDNGFNHRDFNATHVLIGPEDSKGKSHMGLFDLQRVDRKKWMRYKWFIKIMAELGYTMPSPLFDENDRQMLFQSYLGISSKRLIDPFLVFLIQSKIRRIKRHTEKIMRRRQSIRK
jgi:hypothetical protein